jgi:hypothetical protein
VSPLQFGECVRHLLQRVGGRDGQLEGARGQRVREVSERVVGLVKGKCSGAFHSCTELDGGIRDDNRVDAIARHSKTGSQANVVGTEQVDERVDALGCGSSKSVFKPVSVEDRSHSV